MNTTKTNTWTKCLSTTTVQATPYLLLQYGRHWPILTPMHSSIYFLAKSFYTTPTMNTRASRWALTSLVDHIPDDITYDAFFYYSLPTALKSDDMGYVLLNASNPYALRYHNDEVLQVLKDQNRDQRWKREMVVISKWVGLFVKIKKELWYVHEFSVNNDRSVGIKWWGPHGPLAKGDNIVKKKSQ